MTPSLRVELAELLNRHALDRGTPDWVLARYLLHCLEAYEQALRLRARHGGDRDACSDQEWGDA